MQITKPYRRSEVHSHWNSKANGSTIKLDVRESQDVQRVARLSLDLDEVFGRNTGFRPMQFLVVLVLNSYRPKAADENITVDSVAVTNDISARAKPTSALRQMQSADIDERDGHQGNLCLRLWPCKRPEAKEARSPAAGTTGWCP